MALKVTEFCVSTANVLGQEILRRSANYHPAIWEDDYIQSLKSDYMGKLYGERAMKLVGEVRMMLEEVVDDEDPLQKLELVDTLQRLGLSYHFEEETKRILESTARDHDHIHSNLYATALKFRLLRNHGYKVPTEVFSCFMDQKGIKAGDFDDWEGVLNLYEASYLLVEGESNLEKAREFAAKYLKEYLKNKDEHDHDHVSCRLVEHALELPLHWRMPRLEARWYIDVYEKKKDRNQCLLDLAKLDFNILQAVHQRDLRYVSKWWKDLGLGKKLTFARDRLVETFLWAMGVATQPRFENCRRILTKVGLLITIIDDVYDVYGTIEELVLFTEAIERWETKTIELLPEYMKICYLALFNTINEVAFDILKEQGIDTIPLLKKMWADLCKSYLLEAKWYYSGYTPSLEEYTNNGLISSTAPVILVHAYLASNSIRKECLECFKGCSNLIKFAAGIARLVDDLGTSSDELKRGDVPKSIQCYMHETGVSEDEARHKIWELIDATWKKINEEQFAHSFFSQMFIQIAFNFPRMAHCIYQHGDGYGIGDGETKERILSLIVSPILLEERPK